MSTDADTWAEVWRLWDHEIHIPARTIATITGVTGPTIRHQLSLRRAKDPSILTACQRRAKYTESRIPDLIARSDVAARVMRCKLRQRGHKIPLRVRPR